VVLGLARVWALVGRPFVGFCACLDPGWSWCWVARSVLVASGCVGRLRPESCVWWVGSAFVSLGGSGLWARSLCCPGCAALHAGCSVCLAVGLRCRCRRSRRIGRPSDGFCACLVWLWCLLCLRPLVSPWVAGVLGCCPFCFFLEPCALLFSGASCSSVPREQVRACAPWISDLPVSRCPVIYLI
jgi:hypothetical protein